jgi:hypothetical protein
MWIDITETGLWMFDYRTDYMEPSIGYGRIIAESSSGEIDKDFSKIEIIPDW